MEKTEKSPARLLTVAECCERTRKSPSWFSKRFAAGTGPAHRILEGEYLIPADTFESWLDAQAPLIRPGTVRVKRT